MAAAEASGLPAAMIDRLRITDKVVHKMANSVRQIAAQTDPIGQVIEGSVRPNGLRLLKVRVPLGVLLFIYESRPDVTSDAAALCLKSGNAIILRGGKEALHSNTAIAAIIRGAIAETGITADAVQLVETADRAALGELLKMEGKIDLCIPRGGESLIRAVVEQTRIPVIKHYTGNCHVYVDQRCDAMMAQNICVNAKVQRPGVCNAAETILFHQAAVGSGLLKRICQALADLGVEIRGCERTREVAFPDAKPATEQDWYTEYLELIVAIRVVDGVDQAIDHINAYGSKHTDAIVTNDFKAVGRVCRPRGFRQRVRQLLHPFFGRRRIWPGGRDRHQHRQAPRPRPHGRGRPDDVQVGRLRQRAGADVTMSRRQIELVVFDLGRVMIRLCDGWAHACERAGVPYHPRYESPQIREPADGPAGVLQRNRRT